MNDDATQPLTSEDLYIAQCEADQLAALRRRVLDMALGAFGVYRYDPNKSLVAQGGGFDMTPETHRFVDVLLREFVTPLGLRHGTWSTHGLWAAANFDAIVAALYAAGVRA